MAKRGGARDRRPPPLTAYESAYDYLFLPIENCQKIAKKARIEKGQMLKITLFLTLKNSYILLMFSCLLLEFKDKRYMINWKLIKKKKQCGKHGICEIL